MNPIACRAAALLLCSLVHGNVPAAPAPSPAAPDTVSRPMSELKPTVTLHLGKTADWVAITPDAVWVASTDPYAVHRIDPRTNTEVATVALQGEPCAGLATGFGSLWVPLCGKPYGSPNTLAKVDLASNALSAVYGTGPAAAEGGVTTSPDSVWLVTDKQGSLARIDPTTGAVRQIVRVPAGSYNPLYDHGRVWVTHADGADITRVDAVTGTLEATAKTHAKPRFLTAGAGAMWTLNQGDGSLTRVDAESSHATATMALHTPGHGGDIAFSDGMIFTTMPKTPLSLIDSATSTLRCQWVGAGGDSLAIGHGAIWLTDYHAGTISRFELQDVVAHCPARQPAAVEAASGLEVAAAARFANLALKCLHEEYPTHISHTLNSAADARTARELWPAFYGCFDWHSAVHGHWLLTRLLHEFPDAPFAASARSALAQSLTPENLAGEVAYLKQDNRASFERPYGLAWLLQLSAELRQWQDPQGRQWSLALRELEGEAASRLKTWLPKLHYPIRVGEHDQTAFSFGLMWDWAGVTGDTEMRSLLTDAAQRFYLKDRDCPLTYEPSGEDFLSPCLAEADFMRRVLEPQAYAHWLSGFLPGISRHVEGAWLSPAVVTDRADPKLAHLDGLNLSRAWMLEGMAHGLPEADPRIRTLRQIADQHRQAALPWITGEHYEGGHWLGTFAVYLTTAAGLK
jgi:streptogramin lyase